MARPVRLETSVELAAPDPWEQSFSAVLCAVLDDGRRVTLLDDRGWSGGSFVSDGSTSRRVTGPQAWAHLGAEEIEREARTVVGPDEPFGDETYESMDDGHWLSLAAVLDAQGISAEPDELRQLPHDVILGQRLLATLEASPAAGS